MHSKKIDFIKVFKVIILYYNHKKNMQVEQQAVKKVVKKVASKKALETEVPSETSVPQDLAAPSAADTTPASSETKKSKTVAKKKTATAEETTTAVELKQTTEMNKDATEATTTATEATTTGTSTGTSTGASTDAPSAELADKTDVVLEVSFETFHKTFTDAIDKFTEAYNSLKLVPALNKSERKQIVKSRKDFSKVIDNFNNALLESAEKQLISAEKGTTKRPAKRAVDKEKAAIHKPRTVDQKLIEFMGLTEGSQVSRAQALQAINAYVNELKTNNPELVKVADNNKAFKVSGKLETLFANQLGKTDEHKMPNVIKYTDIMKYMSDFFPKIVV